MAAASQTDRSAPAFSVQLDGAAASAELVASVVGVSVVQDLEWPSSLELRLRNIDVDTGQMKWSDSDSLREGKLISVGFGYDNKLQTLVEGEITGIELEIHPSGSPALTVRAYDRGHRLMRGHKTMSYTNMKDSDMARQIADNLGVDAEIEATTDVLPYVLQHNQTDLAFLKERSQRIGYETFVRSNKLYFRKRNNGAKPAVTLSYPGDLLEFQARITSVHQPSTAIVRSWDPQQKEKIVAHATAGDIASTMAGSKVGPDAARTAFGDAENITVARPVASQAEADKIAAAVLSEAALAYLTGETRVIGRPEIQPGDVVAFEGLGTRFSGSYYVTSAIHTWRSMRGYQTKFAMRRNSS